MVREDNGSACDGEGAQSVLFAWYRGLIVAAFSA